jgi:hypothetical protein
MKLRLEKGIIKLRLSASEIDRLNTDKFLEEKIYLSGSNQFRYVVNIDPNQEKCIARFGQNSLTIAIPSGRAAKWISSNQVGIKETIVTDNNPSFSLILEEDLPPRKYKK